MSSSNIEGTDEWSSNESGWTAYIASPEHDHDHDDEDEEDRSINKHKDSKRRAEDVESDDSMASDASSGPSHQHGHADTHHAGNKNERKQAGGKNEQQQQVKKKHNENIKAAKDKTDGASRSKKR